MYKQVRYVYSKSLPRSGHHFLMKMLKRYFRKELRYCEFYQPKDCCHSIPCSRAYDSDMDNKYSIQKSHDFSLTDDKNLPGLYILQYRGILTQTQSYFDFVLSIGQKDWDDTLDGYISFAESKLGHYIHFYNKWITNAPENSLITTYEKLTESTENELQRILRFMTENDNIDRDRVEFALQETNIKVNAFDSPTNNRDPGDFRHFDLAYNQELERRVFEACPDYEPLLRFI